MKKYLILCFLGVIQLNMLAKVGFRIGAGVGLNIAHIKEKGYSSFDKPMLAFDVDIPMEIMVSRHFSIQPEIHLIQKGFMLKYDGVGGIEKQWRRRNFIEFPILFKGAFQPTDNSAFGIYCGVGIGYALTNKQITKYTDGSKAKEKFPYDTNLDDGIAYNRLDVTMPIGIDYHIDVKEQLGLFVDMRYNVDLSRNIKYRPKDNSAANYYYRNFVITMGFSFRTKRD